jgi:ABC-2 type transport system permease protein
MKKILLVAQREFLATAGTRAFIFGVLVTPVLIGALLFILPRMMHNSPPMVVGDVAIIDPTGEVTPALEAYLTKDQLAKRRDASYKRLQEAMPAALRSAAPGAQVDSALNTALGDVPVLTVVPLSPGADVESAKNPLRAVPDQGETASSRLALVVVHPDAVDRASGKAAFGSYEIFVRAKLDDRVEGEISDGVRDAIIGARLRRSGLDRTQINALTRIDRVTSTTVTAAGEDRSNRVLNQIMPMMFMGLLLVSVMLSGQYLLTTTIEEKQSRVVEVLLSATSPMELMVGKIFGQMAVGFLVLALYLGLGIMALLSFASLGMLDPMLIVFLLLFFCIAYLTVGAFMAAIGAAVNDIREAQGLMTPVMMVIMVPWILWMPISRDPNSVFATVLSFIPPVSSFVTMLRMASVTPPPLWQSLLSVVVSAAGAVAMLWFAAKVFRIGLLMFGKPPNFATLVRWVRMS